MSTSATPSPGGVALPMRNGFGVTALVLGIVGIVPFGFMPITGGVALALGVLALTFGLLGLHRVRKGTADNKKVSWAGTILGAAAIALGITMLVMLFQITNDFVRDMDRITNQGQPPAATGPGQIRSGDGTGGGGQPPVVPPNGPDPGAELKSGPPYAAAPPAPAPESSDAPATSEVTVKATGTFGSADVSYSVGQNIGGTNEALPFSVTEQVPNDEYTMPANISVMGPMGEGLEIPSGTVGCEITVDGQVVDSNTANGEMPYVTCSQPGGY